MSVFEKNKKAIDDFFCNFPKDKAAVMEFIGSLKPCECAPRYLRHDVDVWLSDVAYIDSGKDFCVALLNISYQGALIATEHELRLGTQLTMNLKFKEAAEFQLKASVVNKRGEPPRYYYGIKFYPDHCELGQYLMKTRHHGMSVD